MSNRRNFYEAQLVKEDELDVAFGDVENAIWALALDLTLAGVLSGLAVSQNGAASARLIDVALGRGLTKDGKRLYKATTSSGVSLLTDSASASTDIGTPGQYRWVSIFARYNKAGSQPKTDGGGATVNWAETEEVTIWKVMSSPGTNPSKPALSATDILLADVKLENSGGTQQINSFDTTRREHLIKVSGTTYSLDSASILTAFESVVGWWNTLDSSAGATKVGAAVVSGGGAPNYNLAAGTIADQITELLSIINTDLRHAAGVSYAGGALWWDGTTNPAASVETQLDKIITDLATVVNDIGGSAKISSGPTTANMPAGSIWDQIDNLDTNAARVNLPNSWSQAQTHVGPVGDENTVEWFNTPPSGTRKLITTWSLAGGSFARLFIGSNGLEYTINADWVSGQWWRDIAADSSRHTFGLNDYILQTKTNTASWSDSAWDGIHDIDVKKNAGRLVEHAVGEQVAGVVFSSLLSYTPVTPTTRFIYIDVFARIQGTEGAFRYAVFAMRSRYRIATSGTITKIGDDLMSEPIVRSDPNDLTLAAWDVETDTSGGSIRVRVKGDPTFTTQWTSTIEIITSYVE